MVDPATSYCRFIAVFACYASGKRAELRGVVDSTAQGVTTQLKNYYQNAPE